jgi:hypothetical protein
MLIEYGITKKIHLLKENHESSGETPFLVRKRLGRRYVKSIAYLLVSTFSRKKRALIRSFLKG